MGGQADDYHKMWYLGFALFVFCFKNGEEQFPLSVIHVCGGAVCVWIPESSENKWVVLKECKKDCQDG